MMMAKTCMGMIAAALVAAGALGCGGEPKFAPEPYNDGGVDAAVLPPPPPADAAPPPPPAQAGPCDPVQTLAITTTLQGRAAAEAPAMQPEGALVCGVAAEGQTVSGPMILLQQGYCYSFLGQSLPPVTEVDMQLALDFNGAQVPPAFASMAQQPLLVDTEPGEKAAMATKQNCYAWPWPIPGQVKLVVKARAGSGPVAAQIYKKRKP